MLPLRDRCWPVVVWLVGFFVVLVMNGHRSTADEPASDSADGRKKQAALPKADGHWGEDALGFRWVEDDSADARWNEMDTGPFMASSLVTPTGLVSKSVSVRVGESELAAAVCFDTQRLGWRCGWTGGFLRYTPARFGVIAPPEIAGTVAFAVPEEPSWNGQRFVYHGHYRYGARVVLSYTIDGCGVLDSPWAKRNGERVAFERTLHVDASEQELVTTVAPSGTSVRLFVHDTTMAHMASLEAKPNQPVRLRIVGRPKVIQLTVVLGDGISASSREENAAAQTDLMEWTRGGPSQWGDPLRTQGVPGDDTGALAVDRIEVPFQNPYRALMFLSGHDFLPGEGEAAVSTMHGDVWRVTGLDESLHDIRWKRIATGLYQPLGLRVVNGQIYVLGRDRITRLHDLNHDQEIDYYESFCNEMPTSAGGHDFSTCLETDSQGRFYYVSQAGVHRVSADGKHWETVATGLRNANGMGINARDCVTVAPQEGEWTPASAVYEVTSGGYYGYGGPQVTADRPLGYDRPLFWSPRLFDNSTGGQVWVERDNWGPLSGHMLTLSFGQCRVLFNLLEPRRYEVPSHWPVTGTRHVDVPANTPSLASGTSYVQGGSVSLPLHFSSGIMRGRMNCRDGHLYLTGLRGWVSAAAADGCFQRVRYTRRPFYRPIEIRTLENGLALTFSEPLDRATAEDPDSYNIEQWNYDYGAHYGSQDFKVSQPMVAGRDAVPVRTATLLDERTVFLQIDSVQPVMQMAIAYSLNAQDGHAMRDIYYHTINVVPPVRIDERRLTQPSSGKPHASATDVAQGLLWQFESLTPAAVEANRETNAAIDWRVDRLAALAVPAGDGPSSLLPSGAFRALADGFVQLPLRDRITFSVQGRGSVSLHLNDQLVLAGEGEDLSMIARRTVPLHKGLNRIQIAYESPPSGDAWMRIEWSGSEFGTEAIPPASLFYRSDHRPLQQATLARRGAELVARGRCDRCHSLDAAPASQTAPGPDLRGIGSRVRREWIAQWLYHPDALREAKHREMPTMLDANSIADRQTALDLATFLSGINAERPEAGSANTENTRFSTDQIELGSQLFQSLNCKVCHHLEGALARDPFQRLSLSFVRWKLSPSNLIHFLQKPNEHYTLSRMPRFALTDDEAAALAAYLLHHETIDDVNRDLGQVETLPEWTHARGDVAAGRQAFVTLGCDACHGDPTGEIEKKVSTAKRLDEVNGASMGCVSVERMAAHRGPHYPVTEDDRLALVRFLEQKNWSRLAQSCTVEATTLAMERYRCQACHDRDQQASDRLNILAEEGDGQLPELLPSLTWSGEKLHTEWVRRLLRGEYFGVTRPWLRARMPQFPAIADRLAEGLAQQHGLSPRSSKDADSLSNQDTEMRENGHRLIQKTALDCVQCHAIGSQQPQGDDRTQIALGINFVETRERLREEFFHRFVLDPPRFDVRTKMPKLAIDGRTTKVTDIYEGDARRQFQAIWQYIQHTGTDAPTVPKGKSP